MDHHQKFNFSLISDTLSIGGYWGQPTYASKKVFNNLLDADIVAVGNQKEAVLVVAADTSVIGTDFAGEEIEGTAVVAYHSHCHS